MSPATTGDVLYELCMMYHPPTKQPSWSECVLFLLRGDMQSSGFSGRQALNACVQVRCYICSGCTCKSKTQEQRVK